jgi:hypothetical protein
VISKSFKNQGRNLQLRKSSEKENTSDQRLWVRAKAVISGKLIAVSANIEKSKWLQINNLMTHLKILEKPEQAKFQIIRWKEILKIRKKSNELGNKKHNKLDLWNEGSVLGNKIGKPLAKLTKQKREKPN